MQELYIPRKHYIQTEKDIANCPDCDALLVVEKCPIMILAASELDEGDFVTNVPKSHFCHNCPVVVISQESLQKTVELTLKMTDSYTYGAIGLVDFDAVPEEKRHLELGSDENPFPVINFLSDHNPWIKPKKVKDKLTKKVSKNAPCPCGSGKKHKRCCM